MAIIKCPKCGANTSDKVDNCPRCKLPINGRLHEFYIAQAADAYSAGRYQEAKNSIDKASMLAPGDAIVVDWVAAINDAIEAAQVEEINLLFLSAKQSLNEGHVAEAADYIKELLRRDPDNENFQEVNRQVKESMIILKQQENDNIYNASVTALQARQLDEARNHADELLRREPNNQKYLDLSQAIDAAVEKMRQEENEMLHATALSAIDNGNFDEARDYAAELLRREPDNQKYLDLPQAIDAAVEKMRQEENKMLYATALSAIDNGNIDEARDYAAELLRREPNDEKYLDLSQAIDAAVEKKRQEENEMLHATALNAIDDGNFDEARDYAAELLRREPNDEKYLALSQAIDEALENKQQEENEMLHAMVLNAIDDGNYDEARDYAAELQRREPLNATYKALLTTIAEAENAKQAEVVYDAAYNAAYGGKPEEAVDYMQELRRLEGETERYKLLMDVIEQENDDNQQVVVLHTEPSYYTQHPQPVVIVPSEEVPMLKEKVRYFITQKDWHNAIYYLDKAEELAGDTDSDLPRLRSVINKKR